MNKQKILDCSLAQLGVLAKEIDEEINNRKADLLLNPEFIQDKSIVGEYSVTISKTKATADSEKKVLNEAKVLEYFIENDLDPNDFMEKKITKGRSENIQIKVTKI